MDHTLQKTRILVETGMLGAISAVLMLFEFPLPFLAPPFYEIDLSEVPVLIGTFALGPLSGAVIELLKILLNLMINGTATAFVGEIGNYLIGCAFALPAGIIYQHHKSKKQAVLALCAGTVSMTILGCLVNAFLLLPTYAAAFGLPLEQIIAMGTALHSSIDSVTDFVLLTVAPFNLFKGILVSFLTLLIYKHISPILKEKR